MSKFTDNFERRTEELKTGIENGNIIHETPEKRRLRDLIAEGYITESEAKK